MKHEYYPKLICVTLLLMIHLFFNDSVCSSTQLQSQNVDMTIDSLLLEGDVGAVKLKYDNYEYKTYTSQELETLFINIDFITTLDLNRMDEYVSHYKTLSSQYEVEYVGDNAYKAYEKFLQLSNQIVKAEALKYYYISLFFKIHHFNRELTSARNTYSRANQLSSELKFGEALDMIDNFKIFSGQNAKLIAIEDSLEFLRNDIFNQQIEYNRWHKTGLRNYKLFVGIIPSVQYYGAVSDVTVKLENAISKFSDIIEPSELKEVHIDNIPAKIAYELSLGMNYLISRKLMIGLDLGYTSLSMNSESNESAYEDKVFYDIKLRSYMFKPYIKYLFNEEIGFSPFVNAGIGLQMIQNAEATAGAYVRYAYPHPVGLHTDYGDILKSEIRIGVIGEIGTEYIASTSSNLLYGFKVGGYYFFTQSFLLHNYNINVSLYAGIIL